MPTLPEVHRLVRIIDIDGREFCSRIEDVGAGVLVLARPLNLPVEHAFATGQLLFVSWPDMDGLTTATGKLIAHRRRGPLAMWVVQQLGELTRQQRRQYVRVPALGPIELVALGEPGQPFPHLAGHLIDVSEAALRCALRPSDADLLQPGAELTVGFSLDQRRFTLPASLLRIERQHGDDAELVVTFDIEDAEASVLRRLVFGEQLKQRRFSA